MAYNVSTKFRERAYSGGSVYKCNLTINGNQVPMSQIKSIKISDPIIDGTNKNFYIGTFVSKSLTITFKNLNGLDIKSGNEVYLEISQFIDDTTGYEIVPIGHFLIEDLAENYTTTCEITCLDYGVKFKPNIDYSEAFDENGEITIDNLLRYICNHYNVQLGTYPSINGNVKTSVFDSTLSGKQYISYIAEIKGSNAKIGRDGKLYLRPIKSSPVAVINAKKGQSWELGEEYKITRVCYEDAVRKFENGNTNNNTLYIRSDNPFVISQSVVDNIYSLVNGLDLYSVKCRNYGDVSLDSFDIVEYQIGNKSYKTYYNNEIVYEMTIMCDVKTQIPSAQQQEVVNIIAPTEESRYRIVRTQIDQATGQISLISKEAGDLAEDLSKYKTSTNLTITSHGTSITALQTTTKTIEESVEEIEGEFDTFVNTTYAQQIQNLQNQIDGAIQFWNGANIPTLSNYPASNWTTEDDRVNHQADIYTVIIDVDGELKQGKSYRFDKVNDVWQWIELTDNELSAVQALATSKAKVFVTTPTAPYAVGDLWLKDNELYKCKTAKDSSGSYSSSDWEKATKYTDDTKANAAQSTANAANTAATNANTKIDNLQIGGRNLARKGCIKKYGNANNTTVNDENFLTNGGFTFSRTAVANEGPMIDNAMPIVKGTDYVTNFKIKFNVSSVDYIHIYNGHGHINTKVYIDDIYKDSFAKNIPFPNDLKEHKVTMYYTANADRSPSPTDTGTVHTILQPIKAASVAYTATVTGFKTEIGNKATDWTPAPEDVDEAINNKISNVDVEYYLSTSNTSLSGGSWVTTAPTWVNGKYMWSRTKITNGAGTVSYSPSENGTCIAGAKGENGANGKDGTSITIKSTSVTYQASTSGTTTPTGTWSTTIPSVTNGQYLWTKTVVTYSDNTSTTSYAVAYKGTNGTNGKDGTNGTNGTNGINAYTHIRYSSNSDGTDFTTNPSGKTYIGIYNGTSSTAPTDKTSYTWSKYVGNNGTNGKDGKDGNGINSITYYYAVTTTQTAPSASSVTSTTIPTLSATNKYLWQKEVIDFTDSSVDDKTSVILIAVYGDKGSTGATGATGKGVKSIVEQYYLSTSNTAQSGGSWSTTQPTWASGKYIWCRSHITWSDDTTTDTTPVLANGLNSANSTANTAKSTADTAKSTADTAKSTADTAKSTATTASTTANSALDKINNLKIGGENLLLYTNRGKLNWGFNHGNMYKAPTLETIKWLGVDALKVTSNGMNESYTTNWCLINYNDANIYKVLEPSQEYVLSFDSTNKHTSFGIQEGNGTNNIVKSQVASSETLIDNEGNEYYHLVFKFTTNATFTRSGQYIYIASDMGYMKTAGEVRKYANIKIEKGNVATSWSASPKDSSYNNDVIIGTQTAATGAWLGVANFPALLDGQQITYWLPYSGSGNATLNLTLSNGNTTGPVNVYYRGSTRATTHFAAGTAIRLVYRVDANVSGTKYTGWWADASYDSGNNTDRLRYQSNIKAKSAITANYLICSTDTTGFYHLAPSVPFNLSNPILWAGTALAVGATGNNNYVMYSYVSLRYNVPNITLAQYATCYLVGDYDGTTFTPRESDSTNSKYMFTTTVPTTDDGYYYVSLGYMYSTYQMILYPEHPIFKMVNGEFKSLDQVAFDASEEVKDVRTIAETTRSQVSTLNTTLDSIVGDVRDTTKTVSEQGTKINDLATQIKQTADGVKITVQEVLSDTSINSETVTNEMVTINKNGINVSNDNSTVSTQITNEQFQVKNGDAVLAKFGYDNVKQAVVAEMNYLDITGENAYLNVGYHRVQKFEDGSKKKTGFFWNGG